MPRGISSGSEEWVTDFYPWVSKDGQGEAGDSKPIVLT